MALAALEPVLARVLVFHVLLEEIRMPYRLFPTSGRVQTRLLMLALAGTLLMPGCSVDAVQDTVTGTALTVLSLCAVFHVCNF